MPLRPSASEARGRQGLYGAVRLLKWLIDRKITPHVPVWDKSARHDGTFSRADFVFDEERNVYICPGGAELTSTGNIDLTEVATEVDRFGVPLLDAHCIDRAGTSQPVGVVALPKEVDSPATIVTVLADRSWFHVLLSVTIPHPHCHQGGHCLALSSSLPVGPAVGMEQHDHRTDAKGRSGFAA